MTHFLSRNPDQNNELHATWQHSRDSSTVWAQVMSSSSDPGYVAPGAIPWLLLEAVVVGDGPTYGDKLTVTGRIQRVNTVGGIAPSAGCAGPADIGKRALVPYQADYIFYKEKKSNEPDWD
jgi:hypothetical protein